MIREIANAFVACIATFLICAVAYPVTVWAAGHVLFPRQAAGSLIEHDGKVVGSELIAQPFASDKYFQPRPSAAGSNGYSADAASGSNLGTKNPSLRERIVLDVAKQLAAHDNNLVLKGKLDALDTAQAELKAKNEIKEKSDADTKAIKGSEDRVSKLKEEIEALLTADHSVKVPVPVDLVTTSGGGLDPDISLEAARFQAPRIASARSRTVDKVNSLIDAHLNHSGAIIGAPTRVNVLKLNISLDQDLPPVKGAAALSSQPTMPVPTTTQAPIPAPVVVEPVIAKPSADLVAALTQRIDSIQDRLDTAPSAHVTMQVKELRDRVDRFANDSKAVVATTRKVNEVAELASANERNIRGLREEAKAISEKSAASLSVNLHALRGDINTLKNDIKRVESVALASKNKEKGEKSRRESEIGLAVQLFKLKQYPDAASAFKTLTVSTPNDARVWYYAALAKGLATGEWQGESEVLVKKGVERERAGTPEAAVINAALNELVKETGADWLTFYREQSAGKP